ncbi:MAG: hypothetical protein HY287_07635 [Planctomycetes bacterium]|nr:hypothetical protein [Planctomycetota bacterium]MBI3834182.1 hypothetical protein [Planctomycetota bacterium]
MRTIEQLIVIGSGNWGLALGSLFSNSLPTRIWTINAEAANALTKERAAGSTTPTCSKSIKTLIFEEKFATDFDSMRTLLIFAVPSGQVRTIASEVRNHARAPLILSVSKGFDAERQCTMSEVIKQEIPEASVIVLTGPTIANEVAAGKPTRAVLACDNLVHLAMVKKALQNDVIAFEVSRSPTHHEVLAALKGLVAIAAGIAHGLDLGANVQGVLMTEGLRELSVVASFFGIPESVAYGVSGAGDLITTCISPDSRNRKLGVLLAKGRTLRQALDEVHMTVEGVAMSKTIDTLWSLDVSIPLFNLVSAILSDNDGNPSDALHRLIASL